MTRPEPIEPIDEQLETQLRPSAEAWAHYNDGTVDEALHRLLMTAMTISMLLRDAAPDADADEHITVFVLWRRLELFRQTDRRCAGLSPDTLPELVRDGNYRMSAIFDISPELQPLIDRVTWLMTPTAPVEHLDADRESDPRLGRLSALAWAHTERLLVEHVVNTRFIIDAYRSVVYNE